jgi:signal transduction histidine kinase
MDTLLVIDDTLYNIELLLSFLSKKGFKVLVAHDGKDGIRMAELTQPDLILLDVTMPEMDGFEVCQVLKTHEKTQDIPVIFMTARIEIVDKLKGFELGAADYITKPFQLKEVLARVTTHLKLRKLHLQLQQEIINRKQAETSLEAERDALAERTAELSKANAELAHAARLKDEFLANMSHELRSPLNAILGISQTLRDEVYGPLTDKQRKSIRTLEESGEHLLALINDILDLSKIEAEKLSLSLDTVSVNEVCQASLRMTKEGAFKKRIRVATTLDSAVDIIQADERRLKQILVNLLSNAVKFTPESGSIRLEVTGDAEHGVVDFSVQDTGYGIAKEEMKHLFEPFVQLGGTLNRAQEGTGLGLSLVYRLVEMHGGSVSVESLVGQGSCFTISLPWQASMPDKSSLPEMGPLPTACEPESAVIDKIHTGAVILLAEDQEATLQMVSDYLITLGYQVITARDGVDAVEQCQAKHPDLILMDIQMPVMSGLDAIREIRADTDIAPIPIIALTALAMPGDRKRCLSVGANDYLSKPVNLKKLVTAIEALL